MYGWVKVEKSLAFGESFIQKYGAYATIHSRIPYRAKYELQIESNTQVLDMIERSTRFNIDYIVQQAKSLTDVNDIWQLRQDFKEGKYHNALNKW
jgi:hypothetical protein